MGKMRYGAEQMHYGGKGKGDDGFRHSPLVGDGYAPGPSWKTGTGHVKESRLNSGSDRQWRGKRGSKKKSMSY